MFIASNGKAVKKDIVTGIYNQSDIQVISGISAEDQVIISWTSQLKDQSELNIKNKPMRVVKTENIEEEVKPEIKEEKEDEAVSDPEDSAYDDTSVTKIETTDKVNIRKGPGTDQEKLETVNAGTQYGKLGEEDGWTKISYNDGEAFINSDYVKECVMMNKLIKTVLNRSVGVIVCVMALMIFGLSSMTGMSLELYPQTSYPMLFVTTMYPQAGPEEVEQLITQRIGEGSGTLPGQKEMSSPSPEGVSSVTFQYVYGTDLGAARTQLVDAIENAKLEFPEGVPSPNIISMNNNSDASISLSVVSEKDIDVRAIVKQQIVPELKKISDVASIKWFGGIDRYISIELYPDIIAQYGLTASSVADTIAAANFERAVGQVSYGDQTLNVNTKIKYADINAIRNIPISLGSGDTIHVYDVAKVDYANMAPFNYSRFNGKDDISIEITKKQKANVIALSNEVKSVIEKQKEKNPDLDIQVVFDSSESIKNSIKSIAQTLILRNRSVNACPFHFFRRPEGKPYSRQLHADLPAGDFYPYE